VSTPDPSAFSINTDDPAAGNPQDQLANWCRDAEDCTAEPYGPLCQAGSGDSCNARPDADLSGYSGGGGGGGGASSSSGDNEAGTDGTLIAVVVVGILLFGAMLLAVFVMFNGKKQDDAGGWSGAPTRSREDGTQQVVAFDNPHYTGGAGDGASDMSMRPRMDIPHEDQQPWLSDPDQGLYAPVDSDNANDTYGDDAYGVSLSPSRQPLAEDIPLTTWSAKGAKERRWLRVAAAVALASCSLCCLLARKRAKQCTTRRRHRP